MLNNTLEKDPTIVTDDNDEKIHPWRVCPIGKHYVRTHSEHIPPSKEHPEGGNTIRHAPTANICAGVRWLFMKYAGARERIAKAKLSRRATWDDAVAEYKGILKDIITSDHPDPKHEMSKFRGFYQKLLE